MEEAFDEMISLSVLPVNRREFLKQSAAFGAMALFGHEDSKITDPSCEQKGPNNYKITFQVTGSPQRVTLLSYATPDLSDEGSVVLSTRETAVTLQAGNPGQRLYFLLKPDRGAAREVSIRHLPLEGAANVRDLGGYETRDGRFVRWGLFYRSDELSRLTSADLEYIKQLKINLVCDLRSRRELAADAARHQPQLWPDDTSTQFLSEPIGDHDAQLPDGASEAERQAFNLDIYGRMVFDAAPQFAALFRKVCTGSLPALYHCAAGRDRTGVFTAILLLSLGVPFETVVADYNLSERFFFEPYWHLGAPPGAPLPTPSAAAHMARIPQKNARLDALLRKALDDINARCGSFDEYRRRTLGISDSELRAFKRRVLAKR